MTDPRSTSGDDALQSLSHRVAAARATATEAERKPVDRSSMSLGLRMASEFASAILVGGLLGYGVDVIVQSSPWALLVGLGFGLAAGTLNLVRASRAHAAAHPIGMDLPDEADRDDGKF